MSWRLTQLNGRLCEQDNIILDLFKDQAVKCVGADPEFAQHLTVNNNSSNLILILNRPLWISDLYNELQQYLQLPITNFYIGINRYKILGNDTDCVFQNSNKFGTDLLRVVDKFVTRLNYTVIKQGTHDNDQGRYFNFVQPLTWVYGSHATNQSNQRQSKRVL